MLTDLFILSKKTAHEYLLILRKNAPLLYSALLTYRREADIRDMPDATWRDIVADAMEEFHSATERERIYSKIEGCKRTREQQHWKDKVRQTLQNHPGLFSSLARGIWVLNKYSAWGC